ncbi:FAD/NAD(P)-binding domain-containing protein, partial [Aureobasidium melanogenum]
MCCISHNSDVAAIVVGCRFVLLKLPSDCSFAAKIELFDLPRQRLLHPRDNLRNVPSRRVRDRHRSQYQIGTVRLHFESIVFIAISMGTWRECTRQPSGFFGVPLCTPSAPSRQSASAVVPSLNVSVTLPLASSSLILSSFLPKETRSFGNKASKPSSKSDLATVLRPFALPNSATTSPVLGPLTRMTCVTISSSSSPAMVRALAKYVFLIAGWIRSMAVIAFLCSARPAPISTNCKTEASDASASNCEANLFLRMRHFAEDDLSRNCRGSADSVEWQCRYPDFNVE